MNTNESLKENITTLNNLIINGQALQAFEKFYADEIVMQENENMPTKGKTACRKNEEAFINGITEFRGAEVKNVIVGDNITVVEWHFNFSHSEYGERNYNQIAVQRWADNGQIINEKFYYNN